MKNNKIKEMSDIACLSETIIHIGAHKGQEAFIYNKFKNRVYWIEALPDIYKILIKNIKKYPKQIAINALITDVSGKEYKFCISNNDSSSSSIFEFSKYWWRKKRIYHEKYIRLKSKTLTEIYNEYQLKNYNPKLLVLDIQGAELLALKGSKEILDNFDYIYTEYSIKPVYENGVLWPELNNWLNKNGFISKEIPKKKHGNVLFIRK